MVNWDIFIYFNSCESLCIIITFNSLPYITFANSFDPDQAGHNVGPDLEPICFIPEMLILKKN